MADNGVQEIAETAYGLKGFSNGGLTGPALEPFAVELYSACRDTYG